MGLEKVMVCSEAVSISDSNKPWTWDGLRADTDACVVVTQAGAQSTTSVKPFIMYWASAVSE